MKRVPSSTWLLMLFGLLAAAGLLQSVFAQNTKEDLEKKRKMLLADIENTQKILQQAQSQTKESLTYLSALKNQVRTRRELLSSLGKEIQALDGQIDERTRRIDTLQNDLVRLKTHVSELLYNGYRMRNHQNRLNFLFSASGFNQLLKRQRYLKSMVEYRRKQLWKIVDVQIEERELIHRLIDDRNEKLMLRRQRENEEDELSLDRIAVEKLVQALRGKEEEIKKDLEKKQQAAKELEIAIRKAIEEEIRKAKLEEERRRKELEEQKKKDRKLTVLPGPDMQLSKDFRNNYGKLPWPVNNGYISEPFGTHSHPDLSNIQTENNGINITSTREAVVSAVFSGVVAAIVEVPGMHKTLLIKHGEYFTVYANLDRLFVQKGEEVAIGQSLGTVFTTESGLSELHFEVWKGSEKQNPESWLAKGI